jgi:3-carboxy-cis,cis-muconate cycloisomerase
MKQQNEPGSSGQREGPLASPLFWPLFSRGAADASDAAWLRAMLAAEAGLARAAERAGLAPPGSGAAVTLAASEGYFDPAAIGRAGAAIGNPVQALVKALTALVPEPAAQAIHCGATSQDIIDTAAMLLARQALAAIGADLELAAAACARLAEIHAGSVMAARTLLQQAVPTTFGLVAATWLTAVDEARAELASVQDTKLAIQYGGAAGTLASVGDQGTRLIELWSQELGLPAPVLPWHTDRLRVLSLAAALAATCAALGKIARDITLLAQTEVGEVAEGAVGGSSAMPHKRNPVASVVILGCTKQAPALLASIASAAEQELQRAAGAWHAEWQPLSHLIELTGSAASWSAGLLPGLRVNEARMRANLAASHGLPLAEHVTAMLAPTMGRLRAHELVAAASARAAEHGIGLADALLADEAAAAQLAGANITRKELGQALDPASYLGSATQFIDRALAAHARHHSLST